MLANTSNQRSLCASIITQRKLTSVWHTVRRQKRYLIITTDMYSRINRKFVADAMLTELAAANAAYAMIKKFVVNG